MARQALPPSSLEEEERKLAAFRSAAHTLAPWHREYASLLANPVKAPSGLGTKKVSIRLKWFRECIGFDASEEEMLQVEQSATFIAYYEVLRNRDERALRHRVVPLAHKGLDNLEWAMDEARRKENYAAIPSLVNPILERAMPRRDGNVQTAVSVHITLSEKRMEVLEAEIIEVQGEVIPNDDTPPEL